MCEHVLTLSFPIFFFSRRLTSVVEQTAGPISSHESRAVTQTRSADLWLAAAVTQKEEAKRGWRAAGGEEELGVTVTVEGRAHTRAHATDKKCWVPWRGCQLDSSSPTSSWPSATASHNVLARSTHGDAQERIKIATKQTATVTRRPLRSICQLSGRRLKSEAEKTLQDNDERKRFF